MIAVDLKAKAQKLVKKLLEVNMTISCMESCTGGGLANEITNIEGSSGVIKFSAVTYSNEYKIRMGVSSNTIEKYSVYSADVAREMSESIAMFADSDYGVGLTGKLNCADENNSRGKDNVVFISVYDRNKNTFYQDTICVNSESRPCNKKLVIDKVMDILLCNI